MRGIAKPKDLEGKVLGVLGFGRIGQQVARRAIGLGMQVVAYDPFVADDRFREKLAALDVDRLTPIDALTLLAALKKDAQG